MNEVIRNTLQRSANLKNMAERTKDPIMRARWARESKQEEEKALNMLRRQEKNKPKKVKILSPAEVYKQKMATERLNRKIREYKSRHSGIGRAMSSYSNFRSYNRNFRQRGAQAVQYRRVPRPVMVPRPQFVPIGWECAAVAPQLERELTGMGNNSFARDGDRAAFNLGVESLSIAHNQHISHSVNVSREALGHSKAVDFIPSFSVSREAWLLSHILP